MPVTCKQMAIAGEHQCAGAVVAYLREAEGLSQSPSEGMDMKDQQGEGQVGSPVSTRELLLMDLH